MENLVNSSEFWSAITGAVVGGLIALGIQMLSLRAVKRQRKEEAEENRKALGYAVLFKMVQIYSHLVSCRNYIEDSFSEAGKRDIDGEPWQIVRPLANFPDAVKFTTDEMTFLFSLKEDNLFNDVAAIDEVHNSTIELFRLYARKRGDLLANLPAEMDGLVGKMRLPVDEARKVLPKMVELNQLIIDLRPRCEKEAALSERVLFTLQDVLRRKVGITAKLQVKEGVSA